VLKIIVFCLFRMTVKGNAVPLQAWSGPEGSRRLRFPHFVTTARDDGKVAELHDNGAGWW